MAGDLVSHDYSPFEDRGVGSGEWGVGSSKGFTQDKLSK
ncbi:hypothetical protein NSP_40660 [Nodularia spumigena CCY9414]|nr:hypothetical protein NSP_40660 [Nodularia spumigena CCY9414]